MSSLTPAFFEDMRERIKEARDTIDATKLVKKLQAFVNNEELDGEKVSMSKEQLKAAEILLKKKMPDLKAVEITGKDGGAVQVETILIRAVDAANDRPTSQSI